MSATKLSNTQEVTVVTRALDAIDRAHARAAAILHGIRHSLLSRVEHGIDRAEKLATSAVDRARHGVEHVDHVSADAVNRAQGVVGTAIEKARLNRAKGLHVVS